MSDEVVSFHQELFQEVQSSADANGRYIQDAFFERATEYLIEAGEVDSADRSFYAARGIRVDGYGGDPSESEGVLSLFVTDFPADLHSADALSTLTATEMDAAFNRLLRFVTKSLDPEFANSLEETSPAFGLADLIARRWAAIRKVRLFLVTNRLLSARVDSRSEGQVESVPVTYSVWDIDRLYRFAAVGRGREPIDLDLEVEYGGAIAALPAHFDGAGYEAYLAIIPGQQLADIYDRWGARLLEQNVRSFLQVRGTVNKGIRNTLEQAPDMFFAYNNGISATAEAVETFPSADGLRITRIRNLQIVNGGQTTASIYAASRRKGSDLGRVFVQLKLSIIDPAQAADVVPRISEYANSQNRVNAADFFANHPFHVRMEGFSRRIYAPSPDGTFRQSKWFYERARGQYPDARAYLSPAQKRQFDIEYPKRQLFTKTDLAKYINVWERQPHTVSMGAQKNFANFAQRIGAIWEKDSDAFNELFYRELIAKAIVFRETERIVSSEQWYGGGYRAQIVAYAIAKLSYDVDAVGRAIDFEGIWHTQSITNSLRLEIARRAKAAYDVLTEPPAGMSNVSEWAKKSGCWDRLANVEVGTTDTFLDELLDHSEKRARKKHAVKEQKVLNGIEAQMRVVNLGGPFWQDLRRWGEEKKLLAVKERGILAVAERIPSQVPTEHQSIALVEALSRLVQDGFPPPEGYPW